MSANCASHDCRCETRRYWQILGLTVAIAAMEIVGGLWSGSLALLADAGHVAVDALAVAVAIGAAYAARYNGKARATGGAINAALLAVIAVFVFKEACERLTETPPIKSGEMIAFALAGLAGNWWSLKLLHRNHDHSHLTHRSLKWHLISDFLQSVGVVATGVVIHFTGWTILDPIFSAFIGIVIGRWAVKLAIDSCRELRRPR
ncbi:MAG: cation transporter [Parcubacteria group bacterium]|nr:cation transporter [Parcubacteria group bacterium]